MKFLAPFALLSLVACADHRFVAEIPQPTNARIAELARLDPTKADATKPTRFEIRIFPSAVMEGQAVRISCFVPESLGAGSMAFGIVELGDLSTSKIQHVQTTRLIERLPCGVYTVTCAIDTAQGRRREDRALTVHGGMCEGDGQ